MSRASNEWSASAGHSAPEPGLANITACKLNGDWSIKHWHIDSEARPLFQHQGGRKLDVEFPDGTKLFGIDSDDDLRRGKELMLARIGAVAAFQAHPAPLRPRLLGEQRSAQVPPFKGRGKQFLATTALYLREMAKASVNNRKTREDKQASYAAFAAQFSDPTLDKVDKSMAVAFKNAQLALGAGAGRVNTKIGHLSEFSKWASGNGYACGENNPFDGTRVSKKSKLMLAAQPYEPFTEEDLARIFEPKVYGTYAIDSRPHFKFFPFLLCYSGARPDELASLRVDQIRNEQGIDYIALKSAKNSNSIRKIPLHRVVRESNFMAYLAERRDAEPDGQLFPQLKPSKNGYSKNVSRRFNENFLPRLGFADSTKRLYSFRSTFITRMTELNVNAAMIMALVGHYEQTALDLSSPHFKNYQGAKRVAALQETIDMFDIKLPMAF